MLTNVWEYYTSANARYHLIASLGGYNHTACKLLKIAPSLSAARCREQDLQFPKPSQAESRNNELTESQSIDVKIEKTRLQQTQPFSKFLNSAT